MHSPDILQKQQTRCSPQFYVAMLIIQRGALYSKVYLSQIPCFISEFSSPRFGRGEGGGEGVEVVWGGDGDKELFVLLVYLFVWLVFFVLFALVYLPNVCFLFLCVTRFHCGM